MRQDVVSIVAVALACIGAPSFAAKPDRWKGLILDESTPEHVIGILGSPASDETGQLIKLLRERMLNGGSQVMARKDDLVRVLKYDRVDDFKVVSLLFKDDKLALIQLVPDSQNKVLAKDLQNLYEDTAFTAVLEDHDFWAQAFVVEQRTGSLRPRNYPTTYFVVGITQSGSSAVIGEIANLPGLATVLGAPDPTLPGKVILLDLMSTRMLPPKPKNRSLE